MKISRLKLFIFMAVLLSGISRLYAVDITNVTISTSFDGNGYYTITVDGTGFGPAPNVLVFDDFEKGTVDTQILPGLNATFGSWDSRGDTNGIAQYKAHGTDNLVMQIRDFAYPVESSHRLAKLEKLFPGPQTDFFLSFSAIVPKGNYFAGADKPEVFANISSWKFTWVVDGPTGILSDGQIDYCIPTHTGNGTVGFGGNDGLLFYINNMSEWWDWKNFNHMSFGMISAPVRPAENPGKIYWMSSNVKHGMLEIYRNNVPTMQPDATKTFDRIWFPGWWGNSPPGEKFNAYYDNLYVAVGPNSFARIEVADASIRTASKNIVTLPPDSWSNTKIVFKIHKNVVDKNANHFIFIHDKDRNVNEEGVSICEECPGDIDSLSVTSN